MSILEQDFSYLITIKSMSLFTLNLVFLKNRWVFEKVTLYFETPQILYNTPNTHHILVSRPPKLLYMICATYLTIYRTGSFRQKCFPKITQKKRHCVFLFVQTPEVQLCFFCPLLIFKTIIY